MILVSTGRESIIKLPRPRLLFDFYRCIAMVFLANLLSLSATADDKGDTVYLYTYHNKPPFIVDLNTRSGLYFDLATYLSAKDPSHLYQTEFVPRRRLDRLIETDKLDGVVIGVSPVWFNDKDRKKFLWLPAIYDDRDEFVSLKSKPFEFRGAESLNNKIVAGVAGYYYFGINESVKSRLLDRIDTIGERQVLELVEKGRADFGIVSQSVFIYLNKIEELKNIYHFSAQPHDVFQRSAFTFKSNAQLHARLQPILEQLTKDPEWQQFLSKYQ